MRWANGVRFDELRLVTKGPENEIAGDFSPAIFARCDSALVSPPTSWGDKRGVLSLSFWTPRALLVSRAGVQNPFHGEYLSFCLPSSENRIPDILGEGFRSKTNGMTLVSPPTSWGDERGVLSLSFWTPRALLVSRAGVQNPFHGEYLSFCFPSSENRIPDILGEGFRSKTNGMTLVSPPTSWGDERGDHFISTSFCTA
jgi:hypothetical protein